MVSPNSLKNLVLDVIQEVMETQLEGGGGAVIVKGGTMEEWQMSLCGPLWASDLVLPKREGMEG